MNVAEWLRGQGLERYEEAFRDNEIEFDILPDLTEGDLEKLGVPLGHRKKLLRAIANLRAVPSEAASPPSPASESALGERRQLTVMFCDLVGSTSIAADLDPEDMVELIRDFQRSVSAATVKFDGHVAKWMGDGALVYFGYPRAHEDDAERAVRAGLALTATIHALRRPGAAALDVRVGIATGLVVVGPIMGEGGAREQDVVGETPNLAARLQALAAAGEVMISETTRRLLGGTFELEARGPQAIRGLPAPTPVWAVRRESMNVNRFEAARTEALTPFVGREQDVALLMEHWRDALEGDGRIVLLSGEAGIGKSRALTSLREQIASNAPLEMSFQCSPHHANEAFYPVLGNIWRAAGFSSEDSAEGRLDKLEALIARAGLDTASTAPILAGLLLTPTGARYGPGDFASTEVRERAIGALMALFEGLTRNRPVLVLLEDAHWIDPSSLDLFGRLVDRVRTLPVLLIVTFRPEFTPPWGGRPNVVAHSLSRFGKRHSLRMIESVADGARLPDEILAEIVAKADGVPLFLEELTKTVLESGLLRKEGDQWVLRAALTSFAIPSTLQDSLMARLDRLSVVREIAQIGAAIGREFSQGLLEAVAPISGPALQSALDRLLASELLYRRETPSGSVYVFKHALVQDTAYASLLRGRRQSVHADIARALCERLADSIETAPAVIAHHFTEAGLWESAACYWLKATEQALSRSAYIEANRYVETGLAQLPSLEDGPKRRTLELALQLARANALLPLRGYDAPETIAALTQAKALLDIGVGDDLQRFSVLYGLCAASFFAARVESAHALARQIVEFAERHGDATYRLIGHRLLGTTLLLMGRNREALERFETAERYRDPARQRLLSYRFGNDPGLAVVGYKSWALLFLGRLDEASKVVERIAPELEGHGHAPTIAFCKFFSTVLPDLAFGDHEACERHGAELVAYCEENKVEQFRLLGAVYQSLARVARAPDPDNIALANAALAAQHRFGGHIGDSDFLSRLAEASLAIGDRAGAESALARCLAFVEGSGERLHLANVRRIEGVIALDGPSPDRAKAEACFRQAIEIAREQEMRLYELRATTELARLQRDVNPAAKLRAFIESAMSGITGADAARDLVEAKAFLASLAAP
jgi:class 3 adenylate cyclase/tetratricopeptide (TPR) repeat protein